jgi:hypothetical protein
VTVNQGDNAAFSVMAGGVSPLIYQWQHNGTNIAGATATTLAISNVAGTDAGSYAAIVSNPSGSIASQLAILTVNQFPGVTDPQSQTVFAGARVSFSVTGSGASPLTYQWRKGSSELSGATAQTLTFSTAQLSDAGTYLVVVTNSYGSVTSSPAVLTIISNPFVTPSPGVVVGLNVPPVPADLTNAIAIAAGATHCLAVRADGTVEGWGYNQYPAVAPPGGLSNVVAIAAGDWSSLALKHDGTVVGWGFNATPPVNLFGVVAIAVGRDQLMAAKADGTLVSWGGIPTPAPAGFSNFVALAAGISLSAGLCSDGRVVAWGGLQPIPFVASNAIGVATENLDKVLVLNADKTLSSLNISIPPGLSNVAAVSGNGGGCLVLQSDGTIVGFDGPPVSALANVRAISGGPGFGLLLTTNPPPPLLGGAASATNFLLSTPISVPGYVLETSRGPGQPFGSVDGYTNSTSSSLTIPISSPVQFFRLKKQ